ncbi:MAG TPA: DUF1778 domain-containing protein [Gemmatimonadales bacterium]|nr:DUF1778 domain-containing protein [Gemmatimonadales bacterium]
MAAKSKPTGNRPTQTAKRARPAKTARMEARLSEEVKALVQQAADLRGQTLTEFVLAASREKAIETLREAQLIHLATADQERFAEALLAPPRPARRLRNAAARYRRAMNG